MDDMDISGLEVWTDMAADVSCPCGYSGQFPLEHVRDSICPDCGELLLIGDVGETLLYWAWYCQPGCLPDSDVFGPYESMLELHREHEEDE